MKERSRHSGHILGLVAFVATLVLGCTDSIDKSYTFSTPSVTMETGLVSASLYGKWRKATQDGKLKTREYTSPYELLVRFETPRSDVKTARFTIRELASATGEVYLENHSSTGELETLRGDRGYRALVSVKGLIPAYDNLRLTVELEVRGEEVLEKKEVVLDLETTYSEKRFNSTVSGLMGI